jgi:hypothetical protein
MTDPGATNFFGLRSGGYNEDGGYGELKVEVLAPQSSRPIIDGMIKMKELPFLMGQSSLGKYQLQANDFLLSASDSKGDFIGPEHANCRFKIDNDKIKWNSQSYTPITFGEQRKNIEEAFAKAPHRGYRTAHNGVDGIPGGWFTFPHAPTKDLLKSVKFVGETDVREKFNREVLNKEYARYAHGYQEYPADFGSKLPGTLASQLLKSQEPGRRFITWKRGGSSAAGYGATSGYYAGNQQPETSVTNSMYPGSSSIKLK